MVRGAEHERTGMKADMPFWPCLQGSEPHDVFVSDLFPSSADQQMLAAADSMRMTPHAQALPCH